MNNDLYNKLMRAALAQHQHWLYRSATGVSDDAKALVDDFGGEVAQAIYSTLPELTPNEQQALLRGKYTTGALRSFRSQVNSALSDFGTSLRELLDTTGADLAGYESSYATRLLGAVAENIRNPNIESDHLYEVATLENPILGKLYEDWFSDIESSTRRKVFDTVRRGVSDGLSTDAIVRSVRGTKAASRKDGILNVTRNEADMLVRTTRTAVSNVAYEQTYAALGAEYVMVCATLDGRTSMYCATHDGVRYKLGTKYPSPPYHPHCRTVLMPDVNNGEFELRTSNTSFKSISKMTGEEREKLEYSMVDGKNYSQWFASQSAEFQKEWLGPARYKLYKDGNYSLNRFTDANGSAYTISELKSRDEKTFSDLGL